MMLQPWSSNTLDRKIVLEYCHVIGISDGRIKMFDELIEWRVLWFGATDMHREVDRHAVGEDI